MDTGIPVVIYLYSNSLLCYLFYYFQSEKTYINDILVNSLRYKLAG